MSTTADELPLTRDRRQSANLSSQEIPTAPSSTMLAEILAPLLQCPACDDIISLPTTLTCGHTVCSKHVRMSAEDAAASIFADPVPSATSPPPLSQHSSSPPRRPLPSCPIPTCLTPAGARPLRRRDIALSSSESPHADDPAFPPVIYIPPPITRRTIRPDPPPPEAHVKIPNPKLDVTLQRALEALARFVDLDAARASLVQPVGDSSVASGVDSTGPSHFTDDDLANLSDPGSPQTLDASSLGVVSNTLPLLTDSIPQPSSAAAQDDASATSLAGAVERSVPTESELLLPQAFKESQAPIPTPAAVVVPAAQLRSAAQTEGTAHQVARRLEAIESSQKDALVANLLPEVTCDVCFQLFYDPVTTPCQHTFCSKCLLRTLDHSPLCPLCREVLPGFAFYHDHPSNVILLNLLLALFPTQYAARKSSSLADDGLTSILENVPIFPCTLAFPNQPVSLNIFEPRYRLMIRRVLENGTNAFGMTLHPNPYTGEEIMYGTMLRVKRVQMNIDGTSGVDTVGTWRFQIVKRWWVDGYMVANLKRLNDYSLDNEARLNALRAHYNAASTASVPRPLDTSSADASPHSEPPPPAPASPSNLSIDFIDSATTDELVERCLMFVRRMRTRLAPWVAHRMDAAYGPMPEDSGRLSFWMALVLPIDDYDKAKLLTLQSPHLRLQLVAHWVAALDKQGWWRNSGCVIM